MPTVDITDHSSTSTNDYQVFLSKEFYKIEEQLQTKRYFSTLPAGFDCCTRSHYYKCYYYNYYQDVCNNDVLDFPEQKPYVSVPQLSYMEILRLNSPERLYIIIGCISAAFLGAALPTLAILLTEIIRVSFTLGPLTQEKKTP